MNSLYYPIGVGAALVALDFAVSRYQGKHSYGLKDTAANLTMSLGEAAITIVFIGLVYSLYNFLYDHAIFDLGQGALPYLVSFVLGDFFSYWQHYLSHKTRWMWASHVVHHSSQHYNLTVGIRQPWTSHLSLLFLVSAPAVWVGVPPAIMASVNLVSAIIQYLVHTETVPKLGLLEHFFVTPSNHRVHHGSNARYVDTNYGANLIIWDKLFGTYAAERDDDPVKFGIIDDIKTHNPLRIAFHQWGGLIKDVAQLKDWRNIPMAMFGPPGWREDGTGMTTAQYKAAWAEREKGTT